MGLGLMAYAVVSLGSRCSCCRLRRAQRREVLADQELLVHVLGQRRLRPDVAEEQQLRRCHRRHLRYPQEKLRQEIQEELSQEVSPKLDLRTKSFDREFSIKLILRILTYVRL